MPPVIRGPRVHHVHDYQRPVERVPLDGMRVSAGDGTRGEPDAHVVLVVEVEHLPLHNFLPFELNRVVEQDDVCGCHCKVVGERRAAVVRGDAAVVHRRAVRADGAPLEVRVRGCPIAVEEQLVCPGVYLRVGRHRHVQGAKIFVSLGVEGAVAAEADLERQGRLVDGEDPFRMVEESGVGLSDGELREPREFDLLRPDEQHLEKTSPPYVLPNAEKELVAERALVIVTGSLEPAAVVRGCLALRVELQHVEVPVSVEPVVALLVTVLGNGIRAVSNEQAIHAIRYLPLNDGQSHRPNLVPHGGEVTQEEMVVRVVRLDALRSAQHRIEGMIHPHRVYHGGSQGR
mmetsp:Transcript_11932/g.22980  ORF Transcript_11932/g.22980 Transcript_11932/m.22980 type:complete len:345 (-) Transcript_11932:123-1157(-)